MNPSGESSRLRRTILLVVSMGILLLLALVNRKLDCHFLKMRAWDVLRVCDLLTLFAISPLGVAIMWDYMDSCEAKARRWLCLVFVLGVFLLGMGFGMHEPSNAMQIAGYSKIQDVRESLLFFDDKLGHWIFFAGMILSLVALSAAETANPFERPIPRWMTALSAIAGASGAVSLYGNMVNDQRTSVDMGVVLACLALIALCHWRSGFAGLNRLPMTLSFYVCLGAGSIATYGVWIVRACL